MTENGEEPNIYDLLNTPNTTVEQIRALLREFKDVNPQEVLVSGGTKEEVIKHLKRAVAVKAVPFDRVLILLHESEENGDQHIFYVKPKNPKTLKICRDGALIAEKLWGEDWGDMGFPFFKLPHDSYQWADFRIGLPGKPKDWIAKLYGHEVHYKYIREEFLNGELVKYYSKREENTTCLARWNDPDLLELRIPRTSSTSHGSIEKRLQMLWQHLSPALSAGDFIAWELNDTRRGILQRRDEHKATYRVTTLEFTDSELGKASFSPNTDDEGADDAEERKAAIDAYLKGKGDCHHLIITWHADESAKALPDDLKVISGGKDTNEVVIKARTSSAAVDYVTNQLRHFSQPAPGTDRGADVRPKLVIEET
jgi:hypothetical protein